MLLTITNTRTPATDLSWLLMKHPDRVQRFDLSFGAGHIFFPEASDTRCTAALMLEVDPVALVRKPKGSEGFSLGQYTNDRPYVCASHLCVALSRILGTALNGHCPPRPELVERPLDLEVTLTALPCRGDAGHRGPELVRQLFEPLGYTVALDGEVPLWHERPQWGSAPVRDVILRHTITVSQMLQHLSVLVPVLDGDKHYYVGTDEVEKLVARGEGWLGEHPHRELISARYLRHQRALTRMTLARLVDDLPDETAPPTKPLEPARLSLNDIRLDTVAQAVEASGARTVADLGCGEGKLIKRLLKLSALQHIIGIDVSTLALERAHRRLRVDQLSERQKRRLRLVQGSAVYRDRRLDGVDVICAVEVIEHMDLERLDAFVDAVFAGAQPRQVLITTPNAEYNVRYEALSAGHFRHDDHRFEWRRGEFEAWAQAVAEAHDYTVKFEAIGPVDDAVGAPTQMGVFSRREAEG
ncbi:MAG: 3' terminal RNA ribose 2'-O-methyltransferase Hen1 [Bradymonadia bacterium]